MNLGKYLWWVEQEVALEQFPDLPVAKVVLPFQ